MIEAAKFRHFLFNDYIGQGPWRVKNLLRLDLDHFDFISHHLMIREKKTGQLVATMRLRVIPEGFQGRCYSGQEFSLAPLFQMPGPKLEIGRLCVLPQHRQGKVLGLVWKSLIRLLQKNSIRYLFGLTSVGQKGQDFRRAHESILDLAQTYQAVLQAPEIRPLAASNWPAVEGENHGASAHKAPGLLKFYLLAGGKISPTPAFDPLFHCLDYFTLMDLKNLSLEKIQRFTGERTDHGQNH